MPGGATAPEQLRWRHLGAGGRAVVRAPPCLPGLLPAPRRVRTSRRRRVGAPAAGIAGAAGRGRRRPRGPGREGRTGWGARPRGPNTARRPPGRPRAPGPAAGLQLGPGLGGGGLPGRLGLPGRRLTARPRLCRGASERAPGLPRGRLSRARSAGEGPGVTEAPIFSRACGPREGRRMSASGAGGRRERGAGAPWAGWATRAPCWNFSLASRDSERRPSPLPGPFPPPGAAPGDGGGRLGMGPLGEGRVWENAWLALESGAVLPPSPGGACLPYGSPSPSGAQQ